MSLQKIMHADMIIATKQHTNTVRDNLKFILGEFQRASTNREKTIDDDTAVRVLRKLQKNADETIDILKKKNSDFTDHKVFKDIVESYLPQMVTEDDIKSFITNNIDLSTFKNKMQAMKPIMQHFGSTADGNIVKSILNNM